MIERSLRCHAVPSTRDDHPVATTRGMVSRSLCIVPFPTNIVMIASMIRAWLLRFRGRRWCHGPAPMPILRRPMVSRAAFDRMSSCPDVAAIMGFASEYDKLRPGPPSMTFVAPPLALSPLRCGLVGVTVARSIWTCDRV